MPDDTTAAPSAAIEAASSPAPAATEAATAPQAPESSKPMTFEEAADAVDFGSMTDAQFAAFEKGDLSALTGTKPKTDDDEDVDGGATTTTPKASKPEKFSSHEEPGTRLKAALAAKTPEELEKTGADLMRVSIKGLKPTDRTLTVKALDLIRAGTPPSQAFAEVFGITSQPAPTPAGEQPAQEQQPDAPVAPAAPNVAEMEANLATLQAKYKEAKEAYDPAASDILEQMTDLKLDLRDARREAATAQTTWNQQQAASHQRVTDLYGELITDPDSGFMDFCNDEILLAEAKNDPIIFQPDWPEKIGQRVIGKYFKGKEVKNSAPEEDAPQTIPPAPRQSVRLPGSPVGPGFSAGALSPQTAMAEIDKLTPEQQDAFINSLDRLTSPKPLSVHSFR